MNRLDGKVAIITGGTQGLGAATARQFAAAGAAGIVTCGRSQDKGEKIAASIRDDFGCKIVFVQADLGDVADCRQVVASADRVFGTVHCVINAAAISDRGTILDTSPELFDRIFAVNVRGPFFLIQEAVKVMIRDGVAGSIVNIGSIAAHAGQPFISAYCASKGALSTLTRNTAFALLQNRIRCNQLNIGWMASDGEDRIQRQYHGAEDNWQQNAGATLPFGRLVSPEEVARAAAFMASDDSGLMTGAVTNFDQSVWGASQFAPPAPEAPLALPPE